MNKQELKELVKKYFSLTEMNKTETNTQDLTEQLQFATAELIDGTQVTNMQDSEFEVGNVLHVVTEGGEHVVAPSGEHELKSGIVVTVDGEGLITGIKRPGEEGEGSLEAAETTDEFATEEATPELPEDEKTELAEIDELAPEAMEDSVEDVVKEAIVEAIAEVVAPQLEELKVKMAEIEEKMKEHYSQAPASVPTSESRFAAIQRIKNNESTNTPFNLRNAQMQMALKSFKNRNK